MFENEQANGLAREHHGHAQAAFVGEEGGVGGLPADAGTGGAEAEPEGGEGPEGTSHRAGGGGVRGNGWGESEAEAQRP